MGINYYAVKGRCTCCGRPEDRKHIGKSSMGWRFSLHVYPEDGINTLEDWFKHLKGLTVVDEYGTKIFKEDLLEIITKRSGDVGKGPPPFRTLLTRDESQRYASWDAFAKAHHASIDKEHGLLRHESEFTAGHGNGPFDYILGDFC